MVFMTDSSESAGGFRLEWSTDARGMLSSWRAISEWALFMKYLNCTDCVRTNSYVGKKERTSRCFVHGQWLHDAGAILRLLSAQLYAVCQPIGSVRMGECNEHISWSGSIGFCQQNSCWQCNEQSTPNWKLVLFISHQLWHFRQKYFNWCFLISSPLQFYPL